MQSQSNIGGYVETLVDNLIPLYCRNDFEKLVLLDAFVQFCQNPTSMSAGYAIEENYPFICMNLKKRYNINTLSIERLLDFLKQHVTKMYEINYDFYSWRQQISDYILRKKSSTFSNWYKKLYKQLDENDKAKFLFLLKALHHEKNVENLRRWYVPFFDKEEKLSTAELTDIMIHFGLGNSLFYLPSRGGSGRVEFVPSLFIANLNKEFEKESPVTEEDMTKFLEQLTLSNLRLLERCAKQTYPVLHVSEGLITQTSKLIVESSRSFFAISPFVWDKVREFIIWKKVQLTSKWIEKLKDAINSFSMKRYPLIESKAVFEIEGSFFVELKYAASPDQKSVRIGILISPYLFPTPPYSTIINEMRRYGPYSLEIIIFLKETLPTILEVFKEEYFRKTLILLLDEREESFYIFERGTLPTDEEAQLIDNFLSSFLPYFERYFPISKTWSSELKTYLENLRYLGKFPRVVALRNKTPEIERKFREVLRKILEESLGKEWREILRERKTNKIKQFEKVIDGRPDKSKAKDFLDGATLGDLIEISNEFTQLMKEDKLGKEMFNVLLQHRKILEHPIEKMENDIDEETFERIRISIEYLEKKFARILAAQVK